MNESLSFVVRVDQGDIEPIENIGDVVKGAITRRPDINHYTFDLLENKILAFDTLKNDGLNSFLWNLTGPNGEVVSDRSLTDDSQRPSLTSTDDLLVLGAGHYTLTVFAKGSTTGEYSFRLLDLFDGTPASIGVPVTGTAALLVSFDTVIYNFAATTGQQLIFDGPPILIRAGARAGGGEEYRFLAVLELFICLDGLVLAHHDHKGR